VAKFSSKWWARMSKVLEKNGAKGVGGGLVNPFPRKHLPNKILNGAF